MDKFSVLEKKIKEEDFIVQLGKILNEEEKKIDNFNDLSTKVTISSSENNNNMKNNLIPNCNSTSIENINSISNIIKNILILADKSLLEVLLNDENYLTVFGALEYDFETYKIVPHRKYFTEIVKFKNLLDIKNKEILHKIHLNLRLSYLKDTAICRFIEENTLKIINSMIQLNNNEIIQFFLQNLENLKLLLDLIKNNDDINIKKDACLFLVELMNCSFDIFSLRITFIETLCENKIPIELGGGIGIIEMLYKTNILALVGEDDLDKKDSEFSSDKLIIWDDLLNKRISELILNSEIVNVKIKLDKIIAVTKNNFLYVVEISDLEIKNIFQIYQSLFSVSMDDNILVLAFPYKHSGYVKIKKYNTKINVPNINAHDSNISFLSLSHDGNLLATSSIKGTLIRIFNTSNGEMIQELRRGAKTSLIHYITFDLNNKFLACSSSSGTIHIFSIYNSIRYLKEKGIIFDNNKNDLNKKENNDTNSNEEKVEQPKNQKSFIGSIINVLKIGISYFESEWSFAQFRLPKTEKEKAIISFSQVDNSINVLTKSGNLFKASFEPSSGGECTKIDEINLFQLFKDNKENE